MHRNLSDASDLPCLWIHLPIESDEPGSSYVSESDDLYSDPDEPLPQHAPRKSGKLRVRKGGPSRECPRQNATEE